MTTNVKTFGVFAACCIALLLTGCKEKHVQRGFYFWKSPYTISATENELLEKSRVGKIYLKYFDVVSDERFSIPTPTATVDLSDSTHNTLEVIPTIYITTNAIRQLKGDSNIATLARLICRRISQIDSVWKIPPHQEVQIDCDWTPSTQATYFKLLSAIKSNKLLKGKTLSATIRLHQIKYIEKTGVPPVDRGMLMCYNLTDVRSLYSENSIFNADEALQYTQNLRSYPHPIDIALPIFSWGVVFNNGRFRLIMNGLTAQELSRNTHFRMTRKNHYLVTSSTTLNGVTLYTGEQIRTEASDMSEIARFSKELRIANDTLTVSLFSLDSKYLKNINNEKIEALFSAIH